MPWYGALGERSTLGKPTREENDMEEYRSWLMARHAEAVREYETAREVMRVARARAADAQSALANLGTFRASLNGCAPQGWRIADA